MTKEELLQKIDTWGVDHIAITGIKDCVKQFFDSNICIPKGENRYPDADVLHEAIEGTNIQELQCNEWCDVLVQDGINSLSKYRIKPSEPIYEWQWTVTLSNSGEIARSIFMTESEFKSTPFGDGLWYKDEETKRVRS